MAALAVSAGITANPDTCAVTQPAKQLMRELAESKPTIRFLIHDRDSQFTKALDSVSQSEWMHVFHTPFQTPNANAYAECWIRTVREECLDQLLILNEPHLRRVLKTNRDYYNRARTYQGLEQHIPIPRKQPNNTGVIQNGKVWAESSTITVAPLALP